MKPEEIELESVSVTLSSAYIFSWSVEGEEEKDKAVVFSDEDIVLRATQDKRLSVPVTKALLNDRSIIRATEREVEVPLSPSESVFVLKAVAARELGVPEGRITIHERKKVYVPKTTKLSIRAEALVNLETGDLELEMGPLPDGYFIERVRDEVLRQTGEGVKEYELRRVNEKVKITGTTERFSFEASFNAYTGRLLGMEALMSDDALSELLENTYPRAGVISLENGRKVAIADILLGGSVTVVRVDLTDASYEEVKRLPSPEDTFKNARTIIEGMVLESADGKAIVKLDGPTGDVLDYLVEVTAERAKEIVLGRYGDFEIRSVEENETEYRVTAESDRHRVTVRVSEDGKLIEETDRVLRGELAEKIAVEKAREIDEEATVKYLALSENREAEFVGRTKVGRIVLHRTTGEVIESDVRFTEMAIEAMYHEHLRKTFGEETLTTERLTHYKDRGYINIKISGREKFYYARIDTRTGKIISEDRAPMKGITAKLKQLQLESKYK